MANTKAYKELSLHYTKLKSYTILGMNKTKLNLNLEGYTRYSVKLGTLGLAVEVLA